MTNVRNRATRIADTLRHLENEIDCWVATADPATGMPYMIPLSHLWDGEVIWLATSIGSATGRNLLASGAVRLGLGTVRDVVLIEGRAVAIPDSDIAPEIGDAFATQCGFDPRLSDAPFNYFRVEPIRIRAWNEEPELAGRTIMKDGRWLSE
jgi:hypothetical protein